jgi:spoIIIJ-associated protein
MEYKEYTGKSVNDLITDACQDLGVTSDRLDYVVVSEGSSGFLGLGSKNAVIKARIKSDEVPAEEEKAEESVNEVKTEEVSSKKSESEKIVPVSDPAKYEAIAVKFLEDVFKAMELEAQIKTSFELSENALDIELLGSDMGILIGKRGATLDSLQYLVSLVVNKESEQYIRVKVDTEDYRERRRATLENLAKNVSSKVKRTGRPYELESMNPYERRIIHSALQDNDYVYTYSEGEGSNRHIVVALKEDIDP